MSSDELGSNDMLSERDLKTRFVPQSDDEEVLWTVVEITGERGKKYKVKWEGTDPATGKPWAQSWVAKRDCTDDLVVAWRAKKKGKGKGKQAPLGSGKGKGRERGESAQSSRRSGSSKLASRSVATSVTSETGKKTRQLTSASAEASSSHLRLDSVERPLSPSPSPPKPPPKSKPSSTVKRKREPEGPATTTTKNGGGMLDDEQGEPSRPQKKRKTIVEVLLPPLSTDDEEVEELAVKAHTRTALQNRTPPKRNNGPLVLVLSDEEESAPPKTKTKEKEKTEGKGKGKSVHRSDVRPKDIRGSSRVSDSRQELRRPQSKTKIKNIPPREERVSDADESQDEQPRPPPSKSKKRELPSLEHFFDSSEPEVEAPVLSSKVGPPRGIKRQQTQSKSKDKRGPSSTASRKDDPADECVPTVESKEHSENDISSSGGAMSIKVAKRGPLSLKYVFASSEEEAEAPVLSTKIGPPRGAKRQQTRSKSNSHDERGPSRTTTPQEDYPADEPIPIAESRDQPENDALSTGGAMSTEQDPVPSPMFTSPLHISIPPVPPSAPAPSPILSPGAVARLELFDRMMMDEPLPNAFPLHVPDDDFNTVDTFDPPRIPDPPPSASKTKRSKSDTPNGLVVPETQSSGQSPDQSQALLKLPSPKPPTANGQSLRESLEPPTIAVTAASASSSAILPQEPQAPPPKRPVSPFRLSKAQKPGIKFMPHLSPNKFRSIIDSRRRVNDAGPPPSSIESFTSPQRVDKGKQRATEGDDGVQNSQSEEGAGNTRNRQIRRTDSELQRRGKELFDRVQLAREAERQKGKKRQLKTIGEIVNGTTDPSQSRPPFVGNDETALELQLEEIIDLTTGANSTTLESPERGEAKPLTPEEVDRLRIELRQEEEESTQEAMDACPRPPTKAVEDPEPLDGGDAQVPPPRSPNRSPFIGNTEDADPVEQPSLDIQLASVIVQPSQGQQNEDMDTDSSPANRPASSPAHPIPENFTDSPERRLGEALSLLNVKSEEIQRLERELANAQKSLEGLHAELVEVRQSTEPTAPVRAAWEAERAQWTQERIKWEDDRSVWEVQRKEVSEEKERLLARVAELSGAATQAEETRSKLEAERVAWVKEREALLNDSTQHKEELAVLANVTREHDQEHAKWEVERAEWVEERARWETERAALQEKEEGLTASVGQLTASVDPLTSAKASAEKDRDFFREQYMQASGFVSSIRTENVELEEKAKIAEGQAQDGVAAIKAMFEGRVKALRADVDRWKSLTELLQEKDARTNDGIRQRAALVPDLAELCGRLSKEKKSLETEVRKLGIAQHRGVTQRNRLYFQILVLKKERASLQSKLSQLAKAKTTDSGNDARERSLPCPLAEPTLPPLPPSPLPPPLPAIMDDPESIDPNDMDPPTSQPPTEVSFDEPALFPCMWRPQWRDQCQQVFDTKEDLERHVQEHFNNLSAL